jgi:hypothetical protein
MYQGVDAFARTRCGFAPVPCAVAANGMTVAGIKLMIDAQADLTIANPHL